MNINFTARHTTVTPEIKKYCERRLQALEKLLGYSLETDVILTVEKYRHKVEVNVRTKGATLNTTEETHDTHASLAQAFDLIEKRVKKEREKLREKKRRRSKDSGEAPAAEPLEEEPGKKIIPSRDYSLKPLSLEEAFIRLESSRKEVLVFRKSDTEKWAVLYRRKDGHFGLVEPD